MVKKDESVKARSTHKSNEGDGVGVTIFVLAALLRMRKFSCEPDVNLGYKATRDRGRGAVMRAYWDETRIGPNMVALAGAKRVSMRIRVGKRELTDYGQIRKEHIGWYRHG